MNIGIFSGVSAGRAAERRLEAITANLANVNTPGYKRVSTGTRAFNVPGGTGGEIELYTHSVSDFTQGALRESSSPYHMALMGKGFFVVDGPKGELLTRAGTFHVDGEGVLQTAEGYPVVWEENNGPIKPTGDIITVDGSGRVLQGVQDLGVIKLTDVANPNALAFQGGGYYEAKRGNNEKPATATVYQSQVEGSNVSSIDELVGMISVQRSFESAKNVMSLIDQSYSRLMQIR